MQIAKYTEQYLSKLRRWIEPLFVEPPTAPTTERCCLYLSANEISWVRLNKTNDQFELISAEHLHYDEVEALPLVLSAFLSKNHLSKIPVFWLLAPDDYQLFLIESLPVSADEFNEALKWRVRSLIDYPIEEALIDSFKLPVKRGALNNMVAAVATKSNELAIFMDIFKQSGLRLTTIDIIELAMRNLTALYEDDEKSTAFIYFYNNQAILNITRLKTLYFTRRINAPDYEQLSLDLLRYFDYFQSQWRHPSPSRVFVASDKQDVTNIAAKLTEYLLIKVEPFKVKSIQLEQKYLLALGCALREDK